MTRRFVNSEPAAIHQSTVFRHAIIYSAVLLFLVLAFGIDLPTCRASQDTVSVTIMSGADDAFEKTYNSAPNLASTSVAIGKGYDAGFRFMDIPIPAGAVVNRATLLLHCSFGPKNNIHIRYRGEAAPSSLPFLSVKGDIGDRRRTIAEVSEFTPVWDIYTVNSSPDLKDIIQEIVDQPGWQSGNALSLFVEDIDSKQYRYVRSFENDPARAASLEIEYTLFSDSGPGATISAEPVQAKIGELVAFNAQLTDPDKVVDWLWRFGDGETSTELNPIHLYAMEGAFTAQFEFTDIDNNNSTKTVEIFVTPAASATISAQPAQVGIDEPVNFIVEFTDPDTVLNWIWRFGDGEISTELNPTHLYATAGSFTAQFEFTDVFSNQSYETIEVMVTAPDPSQGFEGFGKDTTGGEGFPIRIAGNPTEFTQILSSVKNAGGNSVILLEGNWTYTNSVSLSRLSNLTINGMNASVTIDGPSFYLIDCDNIILQGLRIRKHQTGDDGLQINSCRNVVVDHCSFSEAGDGNLDITGWSYGPSRDITVSWCILANTWKQSLVKYNGTTNISFHHNLFYNGGGRFPHMTEGIFDLRNNVMYQWGGYGLVLAEGAQANIIKNSFIVSPKSTRGHAAIWYYDTLSEAWLEGNIVPSAEKDVSRLPHPLDVPPVQTQNALEAKNLVLDKAGAQPRDAYDLSVIQTIRNNFFPPLPPYHE